MSSPPQSPRIVAGDDLALHLVGAAVDGGLAQVQVDRAGDPRPARRGPSPSPAPLASDGRPGQVDDQLADRLLQLGALELEHRRRRVRLAVGGVGHHAQRGQLEREQLVLELGDPGRGAAGRRRTGRSAQLLGLREHPLGDADRRDADPLVAEQELRVVPAAVELADEVLAGDADVLEPDLVDLVAAVDQLDRPDRRRPGLSMSMSSIEMPACFLASGSVRTSVKIQSPYWPSVVQVFWPLTTQSSPSRTAVVRSDGEVGAGVGLGEALRPPDVEVGGLRQELAPSAPRCRTCAMTGPIIPALNASGVGTQARCISSCQMWQLQLRSSPGRPTRPASAARRARRR